MNILVINSGSATLKLDVLEIPPAASQPRRIAQARVEQFGSAASVSFSIAEGRTLKETRTVPDHTAALHLFLDWLRRSPREINNPTTSHDVSASISRGENDGALDIAAVGHRVVHGGAKFSAPTLLTPEALAGIRVARVVFGPDVTMVAVFDTAFRKPSSLATVQK